MPENTLKFSKPYPFPGGAGGSNPSRSSGESRWGRLLIEAVWPLKDLAEIKNDNASKRQVGAVGHWGVS